MERKKKHIGLFVALGISVAVFAADKIVPSGSPVGPVTAEAAPTDEVIENVGPAATSLMSNRETQAASVRTTLAERLDKVAVSHSLQQVVVKDAFYPSRDWIGPDKTEDKAVVEQAPKIDSAILKAREFARVHHLRGAIVAAGRSIAIIDGNCVSVGQKVDGFELKSVTANTAVLVCQDVEVVLNLSVTDTKKSDE
ncbi:MAG: hypothetical protein QGH60_06965 [Phycisphaerae bacterium]|jgi:hypothetical protein|nr:hypothetical protein [Phycisphaerae bacterium]